MGQNEKRPGWKMKEKGDDVLHIPSPSNKTGEKAIRAYKGFAH